MKFNTILFDLDGTLTDPSIGITNSVQYALEKFGIAVEDKRTLYPFIGPPLSESFMKFYNLSASDAKKAISYYREYYGDKGLYENVLFQGIPELLQSLTDGGATVLLATIKPTGYTKTTLDYFGISHFFQFIAGANMDESRSRKAELIAYALKNCPNASKNAVMVGDRENDILGAKETGIASVGVLFGFGSRAELEKAGADYIVPSISALQSLLLSSP